MRKLSDTVARLSALRSRSLETIHPVVNDRLIELAGFGSNPGALRARIHIPPQLPKAAALVVVLHGCTQSAAGYDVGAGWSDMADRHGFAVLFPEQQRQNNPNLCFNWFSPEDSRRGSGEALSIRQAIAAMVDRHDIDPQRIFITGLSAGGAMTSVMLATYPDVFAGGAIIAGLPFGCASTIPQAFDSMRGHGLPSEADLADRVRSASRHDGPWPPISVWHGSADATVNVSNADAIVAQWRRVHNADADPVETDVEGHRRRTWHDADGRPAIDEYRIAGMGHGTPLDTRGDDACGKAGPYMLDAGISSTHRLCRTWGLLNDAAGDGRASESGLATTLAVGQAVDEDRSPSTEPATRSAPPSPFDSISAVIETALRSAGVK